jgi:hypothetical protein
VGTLRRALELEPDQPAARSLLEEMTRATVP